MEKLTRVFLICMAALGLTMAPVSAQTPDQLQDLLDVTLAANPGAPGIVLQVVRPQVGLNWSSAEGTVSHNSSEPLTPGHTFRIASNTKTYVAAAVLRLVEDAQLSLDETLDQHLPEPWARLLLDDGYELSAMTLRMVLSHTSGLNDHSNDDRYGEAILADPTHQWTAHEQIEKLVLWFDPIGPAGGQYSYSDDGYIILGRIVEAKTGLPLGPAVRQLLDFETLGLNSTWWELQEEKPAHASARAHQYFGDEDTFGWHPSLDLYGGGGLLSDARDLGLFMRLLLKGRVLHSDRMLMEMTGSGSASYRLGLICHDFDGHLGWGHTGFWNTFVYHFPAMDLTVSGVVLDHFSVRGTDLVAEVVKLASAHSVIDPAGR